VIAAIKTKKYFLYLTISTGHLQMLAVMDEGWEEPHLDDDKEKRYRCAETGAANHIERIVNPHIDPRIGDEKGDDQKEGEGLAVVEGEPYHGGEDIGRVG
jgi:hypothetical protein